MHVDAPGEYRVLIRLVRTDAFFWKRAPVELEQSPRITVSEHGVIPRVLVDVPEAAVTAAASRLSR